ncbi:unnamed protein product, partial [Thlaspi arvense]
QSEAQITHVRYPLPVSRVCGKTPEAASPCSATSIPSFHSSFCWILNIRDDEPPKEISDIPRQPTQIETGFDPPVFLRLTTFWNPKIGFIFNVIPRLIGALERGASRQAVADSCLMSVDSNGAKGLLFGFRNLQARMPMESRPNNIKSPCVSRSFASEAGKQHNKAKKEVTTVEDPFDSPTYHIPEKPVTFTEGASYSLVILAGLGVAGAAGYAVLKELIFQPKEYKIFDKALKRIQDDGQVRVRIGSPITGYGQESRNRAARQRIPNRVFTDEDGVEHVEVNFFIRGPHGAGKVYTEMFRDKADKEWKYTYLIVEILAPSPAKLMLESYLPA